MILSNMDVVMAKRKISLNDLSQKTGISATNLSILKTGKAKAVRFTTLDAICRALECQPGDLLEFSDQEPGPQNNEEMQNGKHL
jgi:putative transcriptional regulator